MDIVFIEGLEIETIIGIYDWEREVKQVVRLDIEMAWDNKPAAQSEDIAKALNYKDVCDRLQSFIGDSEFLLVETMAESICEILQNEFNVKWVSLKLAKPGAIAAASAVGVKIQRGTR